MDQNRPTPTGRAPLDDAALAVLVREVADAWGLPPQRLDVLTWRERVGRGHRASGVQSTRRLLGAAAVAVLATVSLSFAVVWLAGQRSDRETVGTSPSAVGSPTPTPSAGAASPASPMPKLVRNGDLPTPSRIMVGTGQGYHIVDLATGELGPVAIEVGHGPTTLLARPGGGWVCICGDGQTVVRLSATPVDANGGVGAPRPIRDIVGTLDPRASAALQPQPTGVNATTSSDGRFGLVGWIHRAGKAGWQVGADVIDLDTLATVASTKFLLDERVDLDGRPRIRNAPVVHLSPAGDQIMLASAWFAGDMGGPSPSSGTDHWMASFDGQSIGALADAGATTDDSCLEFDGGFIGGDPLSDDAVYYAACFSQAGALAVRRIAADGRLVSTIEFPGSLAGIDQGILARPSGDFFYSWNPFDSVLSRLDLRTGQLSVAEPQRPNRTGLTNPGNLIVVSADGTRVYTLGIASPDPESSKAAAGVYAFDASTLAPLGHWAPQANLTSIAVSDDGRHVYAAADGGASAAGVPGPEFGASITAYNTSDGSVALIAGRLLARDLALGESICR